MRGWIAALLIVSAASARAEGELDLLLTYGSQPVRLQLKFESDGKSTDELWRRKVTALVELLDRNGDGGLDETEASRLPSIVALREIGFTPTIGSAPAFKALDADQNGKVTIDEVDAFYQAAGLGAPIVGAGVLPFTAKLNDALVQALDTNGDKQLTEAELKAAPAALDKLDRNDDELVGAGELVAKLLYPGTHGGTLLPSVKTGGEQLPLTKTFPVTVLSGEERLKRRSEKPAGTCLVKLHPAAAERPVLVAGEKVKLENGTVRFETGPVRVQIRTDKGRLAGAIERMRDHFESIFKDYDDNSDGVIADGEFTGRRESEVRAALIADRNGDQKLQKEEFEAWLKLQETLAEGQALVTALDAGAGVFELLDTDHNGALSLIELRGAAAEVQAAGALVDGKLDPAKLPKLLFLTVSHGYAEAPLGTFDRNGPAWFLAMDRNADGTVSRREFSGPAEVFARLDADKNDLLTSAEAGEAK